MTLFRLLVSLCALLGASIAWADDPAPKALALGDPAPMRDASLKNVDGRRITIAEAAGKKGTLVVFICNHCPYVKAIRERLVETCRELASYGIGSVASLDRKSTRLNSSHSAKSRMPSSA